jgi:hypothetical protein
LTVAKPRKPTLIDTISAGYTVLNRRLWVVVIPIALDVYIWFGSSLSLAPFLTLLRDKMQAIAALLVSDPFQQEQLVVNIQNADMRVMLAFLNLVPMLPAPLLYARGFMSEQVVHVRGTPGAIATIIIINLVALLVSSIFLTILTSGVFNTPCTVHACGRKTIHTTVSMAGFLLILVGIVLLGGLPFFIIMAMVASYVPTLVVPVVFFWFALGFWLYVYTGFSIEAILIDSAGPVQALFSSIRLVQHHFWSVLGLILISTLILSGLGFIWQIVATHALGIAVAMPGSAYIGSGLAAARLVFYRDRAAQGSYQRPATSDQRPATSDE